ncbi:hypothetical protein LIA77_04175 [Sarocladium implicatum]|nr:hypothetical protein LIA77_04175 [Sarocladium implicatum]
MQYSGSILWHYGGGSSKRQGQLQEGSPAHFCTPVQLGSYCSRSGGSCCPRLVMEKSGRYLQGSPDPVDERLETPSRAVARFGGGRRGDLVSERLARSRRAGVIAKHCSLVGQRLLDSHTSSFPRTCRRAPGQGFALRLGLSKRLDLQQGKAKSHWRVALNIESWMLPPALDRPCPRPAGPSWVGSNGALAARGDRLLPVAAILIAHMVTIRCHDSRNFCFATRLSSSSGPSISWLGAGSLAKAAHKCFPSSSLAVPLRPEPAPAPAPASASISGIPGHPWSHRPALPSIHPPSTANETISSSNLLLRPVSLVLPSPSCAHALPADDYRQVRLASVADTPSAQSTGFLSPTSALSVEASPLVHTHHYS